MTETAAEIAADLTVLRAARTKLASGEMVREVSRGGRRLVYGTVTLESLTGVIRQRERDYEQAVAVEAGRPARSAMPVFY